MSFANLKSSRKEQTALIASKFQESNSSQQYGDKDERIWYPEADKAGNGSAVIRFLPPTDSAPNGLPWVKVYTHSFQGPTGSWFIENCPTTLGGNCPVCEKNREFWNSGIDEDKKIASARKRRVSYYSNVFIIKDPGNPENDGTVKIYRYGKKIFDALNEKMNPSFDDVDAVNPFDMWEGASLRLRFRNKDGYRNYDASTFDDVKPLNDDDAILESVYNKLYDLNEFVDPEKFKPYDTLASRFKLVVTGGNARRATPEEEVEFKEVVPAGGDITEPVLTEIDKETTDFDKFFSELED